MTKKLREQVLSLPKKELEKLADEIKQKLDEDLSPEQKAELGWGLRTRGARETVERIDDSPTLLFDRQPLELVKYNVANSLRGRAGVWPICGRYNLATALILCSPKD